MVTTLKNGHARSPGEILDRGMPSDLDSEAMLLRSAMLFPEIIAQHELEAADFHGDDHLTVFVAMATLLENCQPMDVAHVVRELKRTGQYDRIGGASKLKEILEGTALPANTSAYLKSVRDCRAKRQAHTDALAFLKDLYGDKQFSSAYAKHRERLDAIAADAETFRIDPLTSAAFDAGIFATNYLIDGVLAEHQPLVIAAQLKTMKSTIAVALAIALATGEPFLGRFVVDQRRRVLLLNGESGRGTLQETARRIAASHDAALAELTGLNWGIELPRLDEPQHLAALRRVLTRDKTEVLIVDPLYFMLPGADAGNLMVVGAHLRKLSALADELGVTLVVVHHAKRSIGRDKGTPPELSDITWAGTAEWARQWLLLSRRTEYTPGTGQHSLWMALGGSAGHSGLYGLEISEGVGQSRTWAVDVLDASEVQNVTHDARERRAAEAKAENRERNRRKLLEAAAKFPDGETKSRLREFAGLSGKHATEALADCLRAGELEPCKVFRNGRNEDGYKIGTTTC